MSSINLLLDLLAYPSTGQSEEKSQEHPNDPPKVQGHVRPGHHDREKEERHKHYRTDCRLTNGVSPRHVPDEESGNNKAKKVNEERILAPCYSVDRQRGKIAEEQVEKEGNKNPIPLDSLEIHERRLTAAGSFHVKYSFLVVSRGKRESTYERSPQHAIASAKNTLEYKR